MRICEYRKVRELEGAGLLKCEGKKLSSDGKRYKVFKSCVSELKVNFRNAAIVIDLVMDWEEPVRVSIDMDTGLVQKDIYNR